MSRRGVCTHHDLLVHNLQGIYRPKRSSKFEMALNVTYHSGRLILWRLYLGEFKFKVRYKKGIYNQKADALYRFRTDGGTTVDAGEEDIPFLHAEVTNDQLLNLNPVSSTTNDDATERDLSHFDELLETITEDIKLGPVTISEVVQEQASDTYCGDIRSRLNEGEGLPFCEDDQGILIRTVDKNEKIVMLDSLQSRMLHIRHNAKTAGHTGGRKMYYKFRSEYYWPFFEVD